MLRSIIDLTGYSIHASDGDIGTCYDFLFDDRSWVVRYMVAKTAKWFTGHKVIISPVFLDQPEWVERRFPVRLTREQVENGPSLEEHAPVSLQYEINYHKYFALPFYWVGSELWGASPDPAGVVHPQPDQPQADDEMLQPEEGHLRSAEEIEGYRIAAADGDVGHVHDFLLDDDNWALRYLVVDTGHWLPGRKVLLSPQWLNSVEWVGRKVTIGLDSDTLRNSPEYDVTKPVSRAYEMRLHDYYGHPYYW